MARAGAAACCRYLCFKIRAAGAIAFRTCARIVAAAAAPPAMAVWNNFFSCVAFTVVGSSTGRSSTHDIFFLAVFLCGIPCDAACAAEAEAPLFDPSKCQLFK